MLARIEDIFAQELLGNDTLGARGGGGGIAIDVHGVVVGCGCSGTLR